MNERSVIHYNTNKDALIVIVYIKYVHFEYSATQGTNITSVGVYLYVLDVYAMHTLCLKQ